jgi:hypothetical protein
MVAAFVHGLALLNSFGAFRFQLPRFQSLPGVGGVSFFHIFGIFGYKLVNKSKMEYQSCNFTFCDKSLLLLLATSALQH